jgi:hypothetical protein
LLQSSPTLTQFTTDVETSYTERTIVTTEVVDPSVFRLKVRQGDPNSDLNATISGTLDPTNSTDTGLNGTFFINDISMTTRTITLTDSVLVTK